MPEVAIKVEGLGKQYCLGPPQAPYKTLRDSLANAMSLPARALSAYRAQKGSNDSENEKFWALRNVSFEIGRGEIVGVIGRNGAGKSTLLKILSRITEPTEGYAEVRGRLGSLLEVGTGFHPELTGRENVYLNGAILGMPRSRIDAKFDEIIAFSEVDRFVDTPVKHYSSGMYLRLAFAVAAHLEPEILIIDEVLAVGDAQFQKKCMGKIEEVGGHGYTVVVVTHNMAIVTQLCSKAIWLSGGQVRAIGKTEQVAAEYLMDGAEQSGHATFGAAKFDSGFTFLSLRLFNQASRTTSVFDVRESISVEIKYEARRIVRNLEISMRVSNSVGVPIFTTNRSRSIALGVECGRYAAVLDIPALFLAPGTYSIDIGAHVPNVEMLHHLQSVVVFRVEETGSAMAIYAGQGTGVVLLGVPWHERAIQ